MKPRPPALALPRRGRVLVAEDDADMRRYLSLVLWRAGFEPIAVADVTTAIDRLVLSGDEHGVRAVVSDLRMPGLSGLDLLALLKCASHPVPVILLSAHHDAATRAEARALGAVAVVDKPIDPDVLRSLVLRATRGRPVGAS